VVMRGWGSVSVPGRRVLGEMLLKGLLLPMSEELLDLKDAVLDEEVDILRESLLLRAPKIGILLLLP